MSVLDRARNFLLMCTFNVISELIPLVRIKCPRFVVIFTTTKAYLLRYSNSVDTQTRCCLTKTQYVLVLWWITKEINEMPIQSRLSNSLLTSPNSQAHTEAVDSSTCDLESASQVTITLTKNGATHDANTANNRPTTHSSHGDNFSSGSSAIALHKCFAVAKKNWEHYQTLYIYLINATSPFIWAINKPCTVRCIQIPLFRTQTNTSLEHTPSPADRLPHPLL